MISHGGNATKESGIVNCEKYGKKIFLDLIFLNELKVATNTQDMQKMTDMVIRSRIDATIKLEAQTLLHRLGLSKSDAIRLFNLYSLTRISK